MKSFLLILGVILSLSSSAQWSAVHDFAGDSRFAAKDFILAGEAYLLGGLSRSGSNYTAYEGYWKYDPQNDSWTQQGIFPGGKTYGGISFVIDDFAYVGLGADQNGNQNSSLWVYDLSLELWTPRAAFPGSRRVYAYSFAANGKGYVGGGVTFINGSPVYLDDLWEFDPIGNSWSQKTDFPGGGRVGMAAMALGEQGYVGMGDDGFSYFNDFYSYDPVNDTWTEETAFPGINKSFYSTANAAGDGFLICGESASSIYTNQMWRFDPAGGEWTEEEVFAGTSTGYGNLLYLDGSFFYGLGVTGPEDNSTTNKLWAYQVDLTNGVNQVGERKEFSVFPNPTIDKLQIEVPPGESILHVRVYNSLMALIYQGTEAVLQTTELKNQIYYLEVETDKGLFYGQFVKQ